MAAQSCGREIRQNPDIHWPASLNTVGNPNSKINEEIHK